MAEPTLLQEVYARGMVQDSARNQLPRGAVWNMTDYIPRLLAAALRKRGGWTNGSPAGGVGYAAGVAYAPFKAGDQLVKLNSAGTLYRVDSDTSETLISGSVGVPVAPTWFHRDKLFIAQFGQTLIYYNGTAIATLAGAPQAAFGTVYKDRTVLGRAKVGGTDFLERLYFSNAGDPLTYDTTNSFISMSYPLVGAAALRNQILVFSIGHTERILGSTPPTATDIGDMEKAPLFDIGCLDARSIVIHGETVIFANGHGIYRTDGSVPENITKGGGLSRYWLDLMQAWQPGWVLASGEISENYVITVLDHNGVFKDCFALDLQSLAWTRFKNIPATMFAAAAGVGEELYFSRRDASRIGRLAPIFRPTAANASDANGVAVEPTLEFPYFQAQPGRKRWLYAFLSYMLDDTGVDANPTLELSVQLDPNEDGYTVLGSFGESAVTTREELPVRYDGLGASFKLRQVGASADTRIGELEADVYALEPSRTR